MAVDLINYNPMYVADPADKASKAVVTNTEWNTLWNLITMQTNNTSEAVKLLLDKLKAELWAANGAVSIKNTELAPGSGTNIAAQLIWLYNKYGEIGSTAEFIPTIKKFTHDLQAAGEGQTVFTIVDAEFDSTKDLVSVFQNGIHLIDSDYVITNRAGVTNGYITLNEGVALGTYITIEVIRVYLDIQ